VGEQIIGDLEELDTFNGFQRLLSDFSRLTEGNSTAGVFKMIHSCFNFEGVCIDVFPEKLNELFKQLIFFLFVWKHSLFELLNHSYFFVGFEDFQLDVTSSGELLCLFFPKFLNGSREIES